MSLFFLYRLVQWGCGMGLIDCRPLSPSFASSTSYNNNHNNSLLPPSLGREVASVSEHAWQMKRTKDFCDPTGLAVGTTEQIRSERAATLHCNECYLIHCIVLLRSDLFRFSAEHSL